MTIEPFRSEDIGPFLKLAAAENWVAEAWEFNFLLSVFPQGCLAARDGSGVTAGFVTALLHEQSGWIGNLIVAEPFRGRGIGEALFRKAGEALQMAGVRTTWLTASESGLPLYQKYGFTRIDTIIRWVGSGRRRHAGHAAPAENDALVSSSYDLDRYAWGDRRTTLLDATVCRGMLLQNESGFMVRQMCGAAVQFGPFSTVDAGGAERLFEEAAKTVAFDTKIVMDVPVSNRSALRLLNRRKMRIAGSNVLMYAGEKPDYHPQYLYGLATMGSCG